MTEGKESYQTAYGRTQSDAQTIKQSLTNSSVIQLRIHAKIANH